MVLRGLSVLSLTYKKNHISVTLSFSPSHCSLVFFYEWQGHMQLQLRFKSGTWKFLVYDTHYGSMDKTKTAP